MTRFAVVLLVLPVLLSGGCAWLDRELLRRDLLGRDAARALADADAHAAYGDYPAAMAAYDAYLARYPEDGGADRARAVRRLVGELMAVRAERDRLVAHESALARQAIEQARHATARETELTRQAAARDAELARLRQELAARQAEVARLREDLQALKRTDLQMERPRR
jgi:predicted RNase H-like nuclease (RuvC/YqgF family)